MKTVAITGASAGVGRAVTRRFAREGWRVALMARGAGRLADARAEAEESGAEVALDLPLDVADAAAVEDAANRIERDLGPIDLWINNAMVTVFGRADDVTPEEYARVTHVTYLGAVHGTLSALKRMRPRNSGHIIQVGSALAYRSIPLQAPYCAAKHAVVGFTDSLRSELIHDGSAVELSVVHLPAVNTPQFEWARNKTARAAQPVPPIFQPEVPANAIFHVAENPVREFWVARSTYKAILGQRLAPGLGDHMAASGAYKSQMRNKPSAERPDNLFDPVEGDFAAHGAFGDQAADNSPMLWVDKHRGVLAAAAAGTAALVGALALRRR